MLKVRREADYAWVNEEEKKSRQRGDDEMNRSVKHFIINFWAFPKRHLKWFFFYDISNHASTVSWLTFEVLPRRNPLCTHERYSFYSFLSLTHSLILHFYEEKIISFDDENFYSKALFLIVPIFPENNKKKHVRVKLIDVDVFSCLLNSI